MAIPRVSRGRTGRERPGRIRRLETDFLEDRQLLYATLGGQWALPQRITYSFAPDGTSVGGTPSAWYARMSELGISESAWKDEFRDAAATWAAFSGINIVEVPDDGSEISASGNQQGDTRFGDIRITGVAQTPGILAMAFSPPPQNGGTLAGDIVMSTLPRWRVNTDYDIATVALHEFGHALGLDHSSVSTAVMHESYDGVRQTLTTDDINGIRSLYGARPYDVFDTGTNNDVNTRATSLNGYIDSSKQVRLANMEMTVATDNDWYKITVPTNVSGTMTVQMQSTGLSSLSPRVIVYNSSFGIMGSQTLPGSYGGTASVTFSGVVPGQTYYIRAMAAGSGVSGAGTYGLLVNMGSGTLTPISPPDTTVPSAPSQGGGSSGETVGRWGDRWDRCDSRGSRAAGDADGWTRLGNIGGYAHLETVGDRVGGSAAQAVVRVGATHTDANVLVAPAVAETAVVRPRGMVRAWSQFRHI